jgi:hypothetical protein
VHTLAIQSRVKPAIQRQEGLVDAVNPVYAGARVATMSVMVLADSAVVSAAAAAEVLAGA